MSHLFTAVVLVLIATAAPAQSSGPVSKLASTSTPALATSTTPTSQVFHDPRYGVTFQIPTGWNLSRRDGEVSTFGLDARTASARTQMRAAASIAFNPFPQSTFSGAYVYFSVAPRTTAADCTGQASAMLPRTVTTAQIAGLSFSHGYDEHGRICTESRDEIYTTPHNNACYRFDLVINTFCGGDVSGVRDITPKQLDAVRERLESILFSAHLDAK